jgi:hypothetical protein
MLRASPHDEVGMATMMRWTLRASAMLLLLCAAPAARAATPEQLAAKQLAAAEKAARTTLRAALAAAQADVLAAIAGVEATLAGAATPTAPGDALFAALVDFQIAVFEAQNVASNAQAQAARAALASLGVPLAGIYPDAFYPGDGTPTARFERAVAADVAKGHAKVGKRVAKLAARFAARGFSLRFRLVPPLATTAQNWSEDQTDFFTTLPPTVDLVLTFGELAVPNDAQLRAAGSGSVVEIVGTGPVHLSAFANPGSFTSVEVDVATPVGNRWSHAVADPIAEGTWILTASQGVTPSAAISLGVP